MPSRFKLVIDATDFDSWDGVNSASTIANTFIGFGSAESGAVIEETGDTIRFPFRLHVSGLTGQDLATTTDDAVTALEAAAASGFELVDEDGVTHVSVSPNTVERIELEISKILGPDGARSGNILECAFVITKFDAEFANGATAWSYQRNSSGRAFCVGRVRSASRAAAVAIAATLRSGAVRPVWMPDSLRVIEDTAEFDAAPGSLASLTDAAYRPAEEVVVFEQMPSWASGDARFADVKRMECRFEAKPRAPLDARAGNRPGLDVMISATLHFKTEAGATFDAADTSTISGSALPGKVSAAMLAVIKEAEKRLGEGEITLLTPLEKSVSGEDGVYQGTFAGITLGPSRVLSWEETDLYEEASQNEDLDIFDGSTWVFEKPPLCTITHDLIVASIGGSRNYVMPVSRQRKPGNGDWEQRHMADQPVKLLLQDDPGVPQYLAAYRRIYKFIRKGSGGGSDARYVPRGTPGDQSPTSHAGQFG